MAIVYQFQRFDIGSGKWRTSRRWGTREAVSNLGGDFGIIENTATEVSEADIRTDFPGLTEIGFTPYTQSIKCQTRRTGTR